jgi:hypothetical protein
MLSPLSHFCVAGILPDGRVLGRFLCPMARFRTRLVLDAFHPSQARGSSFDTSVAVSDLAVQGSAVQSLAWGGEKNSGRFFTFLSPSSSPPPSLPARPIIPFLPPCLLWWLPSCGNRILLRFLSRQTPASSTQGVPLAQYLMTQNWQLPTAPPALW